jgi:isochorismate synthase
MDIALSDYASSSVTCSQTDLFLFNSNTSLVRANGLSQRLTTPISSPKFNQEVQAIFKREHHKGVDNPILVGAIPFDMTEPAQLVIPEWSERIKPMDSGFSPFIDQNFSHQIMAHNFTPNHDDFLAMIEQALSIFEDGHLKKVVLSKILELTLDKVVDVSGLLANIMGQNPNAYHFSVPLENSMLIGASPELLIRKQGHRVYSNPLAGSAKRLSNKVADRRASEDLLKSDKDLYEHRLVVDAIRTSLTPLVQNLIIPTEPRVISTPTMWHLSTEIEATLPLSNVTSIFDVIRNMHPTPAMCGTPTSLAHSQIEALEPHKRGFFSGLVGWCDSQGNGEWAIAIRCAEVVGKKVRLFAGAGVVPDSIAEREWRETCAKMRTMINALGIKEDLI